MKLKIEYWKLIISLREYNEEVEDILYFITSEALAKKMLQDKFQDRYNFVSQNRHASDLNIDINKEDHIKFTWWYKTFNGLIAMKEYFYLDQIIEEKEFIGDNLEIKITK